MHDTSNRSLPSGQFCLVQHQHTTIILYTWMAYQCLLVQSSPWVTPYILYLSYGHTAMCGKLQERDCGHVGMPAEEGEALGDLGIPRRQRGSRRRLSFDRMTHEPVYERPRSIERHTSGIYDLIDAIGLLGRRLLPPVQHIPCKAYLHIRLTAMSSCNGCCFPHDIPASGHVLAA